jgi:hypothetical protein
VFGSQVLDIGIGLAMLFAFMSLIATALNEAVEGLLKVRAQHLEQGIRSILDDPDGTLLTEKFFNSPLISILFAGNYRASNLSGASKDAGDGTAPAKAAAGDGTASANAAAGGAAASANAAAGDAAALANAAQGSPAPGPSGISARLRTMPWSIRANLSSYIPSANFALTVLRLAAGGIPGSAKEIRDKIDTTLAGSPQLKGVVLQALASGEDDLKAAQKFLENWFDGAMDRVSGWYKRWAQTVLFSIGLFAAVALNVDTVTVARALISDPPLRQKVVNHAADHEKTTALEDFTASRDALASIGYPIGWTNLPQLQPISVEDPVSGATVTSTLACSPWKCVSKLFALSRAMQTLPSMILGWFITALAIALGAPFWFDLLDKFMQVRSTLKPQPSQDGSGRKASPSSAKAGSTPSLPDASKT